MSNKNHLNVRYSEVLPSPQELMNELPRMPHHQAFIEQTRQEIRNILDFKDNRLLLIVGPCSIHDITAAKEYATKLHDLSRQISDTFLVIMRVYFEKPRTTLGWKGLLYDPHLNGSNSIHTGLRSTRQLLLELAAMEVPAASEFLDPASIYYFGDLVSWGCIGARTASSQTHRQIASGLSMPLAFKNSTEGNIEIAVNGVLSGKTPHAFIGMNELGQAALIHSMGNPDCHIALRGGETKPNYDDESIRHALSCLEKAGLPQRILIDCSHDNSRRNHELQPLVFQNVIKQAIDGNNAIRGLILESNLFAGNQSLSLDSSQLKYAVSLTDPCLDWETTKKLILWAYAQINAENNPSKSLHEPPQIAAAAR